MFDHAGELDHAAQLQLTPGAGGLGGAERGGELGGLRLHRGLRQGQRLELFRERAVGRGACLLQFADLLPHVLERLGHGLHEGLAGALEELVVIAPEGVGGQRLERVGQPGLRLLEGVAFGREQGGEPRFLRLELGQAGAQPGQLGLALGELLLEQAQAGGQRGGARPRPEPDHDGGDGGGEEGEQGRGHGGNTC